MKNKNLIIKLITIILLSVILLPFSCIGETKANDSKIQEEIKTISLDIAVDDIEIISEESVDNKILKYDARTGETTEIKMDEISSKLDKRTTLQNYTESFDPYYNKNEETSIMARSSYIAPLDMQNFPYRVTCRIKCDIYGSQGISSGFLVGPNLLLTAAHCVMNQEDDNKTFAEWRAYPGYVNGESYNNLSATYIQAIYPSAWKSTHSPEYDCCLCILDDDLGAQIGYYGCQSYGTNSEMNNISVNAFGYPKSEYEGQRLCYSQGNILNTYNRYFDSSAYISGGMSGGPFARRSDNYAIGIVHGYYTSNPNISVSSRITQDIINLILEYS